MEKKIDYIIKYIKYRKNVDVKISKPRNIFEKVLLEKAYKYAKYFVKDKKINL